MTIHADFALTLRRSRRRMDDERRAFAEQVSNVVARNIAGRETFDSMAYALIRRDLDAIFNEFYGQWPNDRRARFLRAIVEQRRKAQALAVQRTIQDVRRRVPAAVWRAMQKEAA